MSVYLRKYNVTLDGSTAGSLKIRVPLVRRDETAYLASGDWTPGAGDVKVSKDFGAEANIGTLPTFSNDAWEFVLSGTELTAKNVTVRVNDAAVELFSFTVETFGHASAMWQWDYASANVNQTGDGYAIVSSGTHGNAALKTLIDAKASQTSVDGIPTNAELATALGNLNDLSQAEVRSAVGLASANLDTQLADLPTNSELTTALGGLNDLSQAEVRSAVGLASANLDTQLADVPTVSEFNARTLVSADYATATALADVPTNAELATALAGLNDLSQADIRTALGMAGADLDTQLDALATLIAGLNDLDAAGIRAALGLATANLDTQLADLPTVAEFNARTKPTADYFDHTTDEVTPTAASKTGYALSVAGVSAVQSGLATATNVTDARDSIKGADGKDLTQVFDAIGEIEGGGGGSIEGAHNLVVTVTNSAGGGALQNARVRLYLNADDETKITGVNGQPSTPFTLDDGTWNYTVKLTGFTGVTGTKVINGADTTLAVQLTAQSIPGSDPGEVTVFVEALKVNEAGNGFEPAGAGVVIHLQVTDGDVDGFAIPSAVLEATTGSDSIASFTGIPWSVRYDAWPGNDTFRKKSGRTPDSGTTHPMTLIVGAM